jgi:hypothetical protein
MDAKIKVVVRVKPSKFSFLRCCKNTISLSSTSTGYNNVTQSQFGFPDSRPITGVKSKIKIFDDTKGIVATSQNDIFLSSDRRQTFEYDNVFGPTANQDEMYVQDYFSNFFKTKRQNVNPIINCPSNHAEVTHLQFKRWFMGFLRVMTALFLHMAKQEAESHLPWGLMFKALHSQVENLS